MRNGEVTKSAGSDQIYKVSDQWKRNIMLFLICFIKYLRCWVVMFFIFELDL